jgi:hypothetical protein
MLIMEKICEAACARLVETGFVGGNIEMHRDPPTKDEALPLAGISYDNDSADADGDPRTGTSDFVHKFTLAIDVLDKGKTGKACMAKLALHGQHIMAALCTDPWTWGTIDGERVIEGIGGARSITEKSPEGAVIVYRRQVQIDVLYRSQWVPNADGLPDFSGLNVNAGNGITTNVTVPE